MITHFMLRLLVASLACTASLASASDTAATDFQQRIAHMVEVRSAAYRFAEDNGILKTDSPRLSREQSNRLRELAQQYLEARAALLPEAERVSGLFAPAPHVVIGDAPTGSPVPPSQDSDTTTLTAQTWINPRDEAGRQQLLHIQRGLAAALVLMDSYQIAVMPYATNTKLRYVLTYDVERDKSLRRLADNYHSLDLRNRLAQATRFVDDYMAWLRAHQMTPSSEEEYFYALSQSTHWYVNARRHSLKALSDTLDHGSREVLNTSQFVQNMLSHGLSMGFGNLIGIVQTRRGRLVSMPSADMEKLAGELKPLDILLEKTPFRLTDKMIPGHFGHVAIWLGSEAELRELGAWEQIAPAHQESIRKGGRIVEALRGGVTISSLERFLNIDDLLVLRDQRPLTPAYRKAAVLTALAQVGKEYDFNFDVHTHERIVCSELAYVVFPDAPWPLARTLGRYTISPDNVAQLALGKTPLFAPALLYRDGRRIDGELSEPLARLISRPPGQLAIQQ